MAKRTDNSFGNKLGRAALNHAGKMATRHVQRKQEKRIERREKHREQTERLINEDSNSSKSRGSFSDNSGCLTALIVCLVCWLLAFGCGYYAIKSRGSLETRAFAAMGAIVFGGIGMSAMKILNR